MPSLKYAFLTLTVLALAASSCKKSTINPPPTPVKNSLSFKFNDTACTAAKVTVLTGDGAFKISGTVNSTTYLGIDLYQPLTVGTIDLSNHGPADAYFARDVTDIFFVNTGTVTITSVANGIITGTFQFNCTDPSGKPGTVTNGAFQINNTSN